MSNLNDLFNLTAGDFVPEDEAKTYDTYRPSPDKGKDGVYSSVVRFVPWHKDPKNSIMKKWRAWLQDPLTNEGRYVDCPTSIGEKSILYDMFWKLRNSDSAAEKKLADTFSRRQTFAALIQIIKDNNDPDLEGKIMVWQFGIKVYNKILDVLEPEFGTPHIPFDIFEGKAFHIKISKVAGYNNYDDCKFLDSAEPIRIDGKPVEKTQEGMDAVVKYLKEASPDLSKYGFTPWDDATTEHVNNVIRNTVPNGRLVADVTTSNSSQITTKEAVPKVVDDPLSNITESPKEENKQTTSELPSLETSLDDDLDFDDDTFDDDLYADL